MARKKLDFADVTKRLGDRFEDADAWAGEAGRRRRLLEAPGGAQICRFSFKLRWVRQWYLFRVAQEEQQQSAVAGGEQLHDVLPGETVQDLDGVFWREFGFEDVLWPDFMSM